MTTDPPDFRRDLVVRLRSVEAADDDPLDDAIDVSVEGAGPTVRSRVAAARAPAGPGDLRSDGATAAMAGLVLRLPALSSALGGLRGAAPGTLNRLLLHLDPAALASAFWGWDAAVEPWLGPRAISAFASDVIARSAGTRFTLPLRVMHVDPRGGAHVDAVLRSLVGYSGSVASALQVTTCSASEVLALGRRAPTIDVLHLEATDWPLADGDILTTQRPESPGTLGWLLRIVAQAQTRLVILEITRPHEERSLRLLAAHIIARGGPAVVVSPGPLNFLYHGIVHDRPLDVALMEPPDELCWWECTTEELLSGSWTRRVGPSLFGGAGREDALRFSRLARDLSDRRAVLVRAAVGSDLREPPAIDVEPAGAVTEPSAGGSGAPVGPGSSGVFVPSPAVSGPTYRLGEVQALLRTVDFEEALDRIAAESPSFNYAHEAGGLLPLGALIDDARSKYQALSLAAARRPPPRFPTLTGPPPALAPYQPFPKAAAAADLPSPPAAAPARAAGEGPGERHSRYTNCGLWEEASGTGLRRVEAPSEPLRVQQRVHVSVDISPTRDLESALYDDATLIEESIQWVDGQEGVRLEVAVVGIDFDVTGHPVQDLWLPREGASMRLFFAVRPRRSGIARLRVCFYSGNRVLQTLRLCAWIDSDGAPAAPEVRRGALAEAAGLDPGRIGELPYAVRLEYGSAASIERTRESADRALSLVANDSDGRAIVALKIGDTFKIRESNLTPIIENIHGTLVEVSFRGPKNAIYRFGNPEDPNAGNEGLLRSSLVQLAARGAQLYDAIFSAETRGRLREAIRDEPQLIEIAQVVLEKHPVPWGLVYDQRYDDHDPNFPTPEAGVCLAPLGAYVTECGRDPGCPRHPDRVATDAIPDDCVVCPRHFWGLRHFIEMPIEQNTGDGEDVRGPTALGPSVLACDRPARVVAAMNASLVTKNAREPDGHEASLRSRLASIRARADLVSVVFDRAAILKALSNRDLHVIYFLCHAARDLDGNFDPHLDFTAAGPSQRITVRDLDGEPWRRRPFVLLNGCSTVGITPDALSPFLVKLVQDRLASGVLGTEAPVSPELAREMAVEFLSHFLAGESAGEALHATRWSLLARYNPLGLVYTLYARADLRLG